VLCCAVLCWEVRAARIRWTRCAQRGGPIHCMSGSHPARPASTHVPERVACRLAGIHCCLCKHASAHACSPAHEHEQLQQCTGPYARTHPYALMRLHAASAWTGPMQWLPCTPCMRPFALTRPYALVCLRAASAWTGPTQWARARRRRVPSTPPCPAWATCLRRCPPNRSTCRSATASSPTCSR